VKFRKQRKEIMQVNLTPLIDIVFLLLIFFMVSTSFTKENKLQITLPEASTQPAEQNAEGIVLSIQENGGYAVDGRLIANGRIETLIEALRIQADDDFNQGLTIIADANTSHQSVVTAMDAAGRLGFVNLRISTQEGTGAESN